MDLLKANGLLLNNAEKFNIFKEMLLNYNKMYNLTAICDEKEVKIKHFLDSILPADDFPQNAKVVEIGSGAGFPSLPLKIVRDDLNFTLIESTGKKCNFLNKVVENLALERVKVLNIRAEDGGRMKNLREKFDVCCARAVARLDVLSEYCLPFVKVGGLFIAYKGAESEVELAQKAIKELGGEIVEIKEYELPENYGKRCEVLIKKVCAIPQKYPRSNALIKKGLT